MSLPESNLVDKTMLGNQYILIKAGAIIEVCTDPDAEELENVSCVLTEDLCVLVENDTIKVKVPNVDPTH